MRQLYPEIEPFHTEMLQVSPIHQLYVEQCGNPKGKPVVFLHGGPGAGCNLSDRRFFDPKRWRIVLFDQRGCGRSQPFAELKDNTTWDLVKDIEKIRQHFQIENWAIFGGSWGSTLALTYAQSHPNRVNALILRGIFLMRKKEIDWFYRSGGASRLFPDLWEAFCAQVKDYPPEQFVERYYELLTGSDQRARIEAAKAWSLWEASLAYLRTNPNMLQKWGEDKFAETVARIECHYMVHGGWLDPDDQLMRNVDKISHIPGVIAHGRYDVICPIENAWELHKKWPASELHIISDAGHSANEAGTTDRLVQATDYFAGLTSSRGNNN